jgi:hypothetical protein
MNFIYMRCFTPFKHSSLPVSLKACLIKLLLQFEHSADSGQV